MDRWRWLAEFDSAEAVVEAARQLRTRGYDRLEIFSPYELEGADAALGLERPQRIARWVLVGGLVGAAAGYAIQWYADAVSFPINVGGRPLHSAPAFVPITFESGVLIGAFAAFFGLMVAAGLPSLWRPVFEVEDFERTSVDRYWLAVEASDVVSEADRARDDLAALDPLRVERVEAER